MIEKVLKKQLWKLSQHEYPESSWNMITPQTSPCFQLQNRSLTRPEALFYPQIQIRRMLFENTYTCNKQVGFSAIYVINSASIYALLDTTRCMFIRFWYYIKTCFCGKLWKKIIQNSTTLKYILLVLWCFIYMCDMRMCTSTYLQAPNITFYF